MKTARRLAVLFAFAVSLCAQTSPRSTLDRYCVACHNSTVSSGGLALDRLDPADPNHGRRWFGNSGTATCLRSAFRVPTKLPTTL